MKLWITGGNGLLGKVVAARCLRRKIDCIVTGKDRVDITDVEAVRRFVESAEPTHVVNCAAYTDVDRAEGESDLAFAVNAQGPANLGRVAREHGLSLVHVSTDYVFDGKSTTPYKEEDVCNPIGVYGLSKREGEIRLLDELPTACIIRTSWLFGKGGKNFISSLCSLLQKVEEMKVISDQHSRPTFCVDLAETILDLLSHSGLFHFANGGELSRFQIAQDVEAGARRLGIGMKCRLILPTPASTFPTVARRPNYSVLSTKKIEKVLGRPPRNWSDTLQEFLADALV
jgi:dTDP-4-dehydrorhamnose reductase